MKMINVNGRKIYFDVFLNPEPFILFSDNEIASLGLVKVYFLHRYSIKYASEDFLKYMDKIQEINSQREKPVPF
jgi:hypothetical protein